MTIGILGGGVWGSALAKLFSDQEVLIYTRDKKVMNSINDHHFNPKLKYATFNDNVKATDDLESIAKKNLISIFTAMNVKHDLPLLPLRDIVVFPHMIVPLFVGREKSVKALEEVMKDNKQILLSSQIDPSEDQPTEDSIFKTGVLANVLQLLKLPDGTVKVLVEGQNRVLITNFLENKSFFEANCAEIEETLGDEKANIALVKTVSQAFDQYAKIKKNILCLH